MVGVVVEEGFPQLVGIEMWRGSPGAEFGVLKRICEFLVCFGSQFQDWMISA